MTSAALVRRARLFHALADPTRLQIVNLLRDGERCVCDLTGALGAAQSRLSFHLRILKDSGVVLDRREGRWVHYRVRPGALDDMQWTLDVIRTPRPAEAGCEAEACGPAPCCW
jgi:ArsR family transcriptional regulator